MGARSARRARLAVPFAYLGLTFALRTSQIQRNGKTGRRKLNRPQHAGEAFEARESRARRQEFPVHVNGDPFGAADGEAGRTRVLELLRSIVSFPHQRG